MEGRGVIPYVFKIYASIYLLSFLLAACCEVLYCWGGVSLFIGEMMAVEVMKSELRFSQRNEAPTGRAGWNPKGGL